MEDETMQENTEKYKSDLDALVESEATLSEGFREKAGLIFESAIAEKVKAQVLVLNGEYEENLAEEVSAIEESLVEKINGYMDYVVESWMAENKLEVESGLRSELAESFISGLHTMFSEHYVDVPASKVDLVDSLATKVEKLEESLNAETAANIKLVAENAEFNRTMIIRELSADLSEAQHEKLKSLSESIDFSDTRTFISKVETLKESYFGESIKPADDEVLLNEASEAEKKVASPNMARYLDALNKK